MLIVVCVGVGVNKGEMTANALEQKFAVTGVGIFDQTPEKGIHTFDNGAKLIEVTFNQDFWSEDKATTNDGKSGRFLEWEASINDYLLINGKKPQEWINASWGSVMLYAKKTSKLGPYLEINLSTYKGLPSESTNATITLLKGFAGILEEDVTYAYKAFNNVPFALSDGTQEPEEMEPLAVTGIGVFDLDNDDADLGIHRVVADTKVIQITFNRQFWSKTTEKWVEWKNAINDYILINGKTAAQWVGSYGSASWGSISMDVENNAQLGQHIVMYIKDYDGLPNEDTDSVITVKAGFAGQLENDVTYRYTAGINVPFVLDNTGGNSGKEPEKEPENNKFDIVGVGVFDTDPAKGIHTFDVGTKLIQIPFTRNFWDPKDLDASGSKLSVEWDLGDYILINGKTAAEWVGAYGSASWGCVQMHVKTSPVLGQYLEINLYDYPGLPSDYTDSTIKILSGFKTYDGIRLGKTVTYSYEANNNIPYKITDTEIEEEVKFTDDLVAGVGIFDQSMYKGIHDFGTSRLIQIKFNQDFYNNKLLNADGTKQWVQSEFGEHIKINGKTVAEWNNISFNSVQMHVKTSEQLGGQYLEVILSDLEGLPTVNSDSTIEFARSFPVYGGTALKIANVFTYSSGKNFPYKPATDNIKSPLTGERYSMIDMIFTVVCAFAISVLIAIKIKRGVRP